MRNLIGFLKKEFGFSQSDEHYKIYRIYFLFGAIVAPLLTFVVPSEGVTKSFVLDLLVIISFTSVLILSFYFEQIKIRLKEIFFGIGYLATIYAFANMYSSGYNTEDYLTFVLSFIAIVVAIQDHRITVFYTISFLIVSVIASFIIKNPENNASSIVVLVFVMGIVGFVIHYTRFILLRNLIENKNELSGSRDRLLTLLDSIDKVVYNVSIDDKGIKTLRYVSATIDDILGLSVDEYITEIKSGRIIERIHPEDLPGVIDASRILSEKKVPVSMIYRFLKSDGYIWIEEKVFPKLDQEGNHVASIGISSDVTLRVNNEISLKKSEERYRSMIERNLAGFYRISLDNILIDCNNSFAGIMGFSDKNEIIGKSISELYIDSTDKGRFVQLLKQNPHFYNHESKIRLRSGKEIWLLENVSLIHNSRNEAEYIEGTAFDITEMKDAELRIRSIQKNLELVIDNIDSLVYSLDIDEKGNKHFNFLGPQIEKLVGIPREQYIKSVQDGSINNYFHPEDLQNVRIQLQEIRDKKTSGIFTYRFLDQSSQTYKWLEESMFPQFDEKGRLYKNFGVVRDVSEKKKYGDVLRANEEKYRNLFERNLAGVFRTRLNGEILECNDAFVRMFGYDSKEDILSISSKDLYFTDADREKYLSELNKENMLSNYEMRQKRKDGSELWLFANVSLSPDEGVLMGTLIDITEQKLTSEALAQNEEKFRLLFEVTNDSIFIISRNVIIDCNERSSDMFGYSKFELVGNSLISFSPDIQPDGMPSAEKWKQRLLLSEQGKSQFFYWRMNNASGKFFDTEISLNSFSLGNEIFVQVVIRDITQRMKAEIALRDSEERFKLLASSTIEGVVFSDEGKIIDCNDQIVSILGYDSRKDVLGKSLADFIIPEDHAVMARVLRDDSDELTELRVYKKDGSIIWLDTKGKYMFFGSRKVRVSVVEDITERKLYEERILNSKRSYEQLVEGSPYGIFIHTDGYVQYANQEAFEIVGLDRDHFTMGKFSIYDFLMPDYVEESHERRRKILNGESVPFIRVKMKNVSGDVIDIETKSQLIVYEGKPSIQTTLKNISAELQLEKEKLRAEVAEQTNQLLEAEINEHKETQRRLQEIQQYTESIIGSSIDMIIATDINNLITQMNPAALNCFGYDKEEILGQHISLLYSSELDYITIKNYLDKEGTYTGEISNRRKSGEVFISYISASLIKSLSGSVIGAMGVSRDITEIIEAEKIVQEQNAKIKSIFENSSNMMMWTMDRNYTITSFNKSFADIMQSLFQIPVKIGMHIFDALSGDLDDDTKAKITTPFEFAFHGSAHELDGPLFGIRSSDRWFETYLNPIRLESGEIEEISCLAHDITEKKKAENDLLDSLKEKEVLLKEVHHRVKNNLQVISSILNLQSSYVRDEGTLQILRESQNRIKSMSFIHESLYQTKNFSSVNFSEYIYNLSKNLVHSYQVFGDLVELDFQLGDVQLNLDQSIPCGLIVNELVSNALKYAFKDGVKGRIIIELVESGKQVQLRVEDNGCGLPPGFDPMSTETLGLQLVATLVEQLDGKMLLDSEPQRGTKYLITFEKLN